MTPTNPSDLDVIEQYLKVGGFIGAALFFVWKLFTGWLIVNLKLNAKLERTRENESEDLLAISLTMEKGPTDSIWIERISARVRWQDQIRFIDLSEDIKRLKVSKGQIEWSSFDPSGRSIGLSPGELTTVSEFTRVPGGVPVKVEITVLGKRPFWPPGFQWRASAVSIGDAQT